MTQNDRLELIKAAVELTKLTSQNKVDNYIDIAQTFNLFVDLITVKYETTNSIGNVL